MEQVQQRFVKGDPGLKGKVKIAVKDFPAKIGYQLCKITRERTSFRHLLMEK